ncbi:MAG: ribosome small subunit-dependent GTPase A [Firmicutes bacterium]|nr:ribosome small subunit-dependent GTPase A [Bacillota bacterium]
MIKKGTIVKGIAGFYYVDTGEQVHECKARGVFKNKNFKPAVGDEVDLDTSGDTAVIIKVHERQNEFIRPPVANVEQFVVVSALADPKPNLVVVDKFLAVAEMNDVEIVLCFTKKDLVTESDIEKIREIYEGVYPLVFLDVHSEHGMDDLIPHLKDKKSALAGPSGVGKSTILNALRKDLDVETGSVSDKTKRGKHTTRHVELFNLDFGGMVFDTPGFTSFDVPDIDEADLQFLFPDIDSYRGQCRFNGCRHLTEPDCAVREAVEAGDIHELRYKSYCSQIEEIRERERKKY